MIDSRGAQPAFLGYKGFTKSLCTSVNEEIVHGIPSNRVLEEGDIVTIDSGLIYKGYYADSAATFAVGEISRRDQKLLDVCRESLFLGIKEVNPGQRVGDYSSAVQTHAENAGFSVVRKYSGHGIGQSLHEPPHISNFGNSGRGFKWEEGMVVALEPMICMGDCDTEVLDDNWTVVTVDKKKSAHFEHTVAITKEGPRILTL